MREAQEGGAAAKSLQSCPTLCDPIDGRPPGSAIPGILQARTLEWVAISFSKARHGIKTQKWNNQQLSKKVNKTDTHVTESLHMPGTMLATTILKLPSNVDTVLPILQMKVLASEKLQNLFKVYRF